MTNELTYFTVVGYYYAITAPIPGGDTNIPQFGELEGAFVTFTPRVPPGFVVDIPNLDLGSGNTGATAVALAPIRARLFPVSTSGNLLSQLATINQADTPGIQLVSNSGIISTYLQQLNIPGGNLIYDVRYDQVQYNSGPQSISPFAFQAPTDNSTVCITSPGLTRLPYAPERC